MARLGVQNKYFYFMFVIIRCIGATSFSVCNVSLGTGAYIASRRRQATSSAYCTSQGVARRERNMDGNAIRAADEDFQHGVVHGDV